jgi:hypothetical protein
MLGMRSVLAVGLALACYSNVARAADKDANGTWKWTVTTQDGQTFEPTLKLKQDGEKLTGVIIGRNNNETEIKDGKIKDGTLTFTVVRERNGQTIVQSYTGKLDGDAIKGKISMEVGGETRERDWEAKRS